MSRVGSMAPVSSWVGGGCQESLGVARGCSFLLLEPTYVHLSLVPRVVCVIGSAGLLRGGFGMELGV